jgi:hypothetical protein
MTLGSCRRSSTRAPSLLQHTRVSSSRFLLPLAAFMCWAHTAYGIRHTAYGDCLCACIAYVLCPRLLASPPLRLSSQLCAGVEQAGRRARGGMSHVTCHVSRVLRCVKL